MVVAVPVSPMQTAAVFVRNALDRSGGGRDIEAADGANCDPAKMGSGFLPGRNDSLDQITGAKIPYSTSTLRTGAGETVFVHPAHLTATPSRGGNGEGLLLRIELYRRARFAHAGRVDPMGFGVVLGGTIELGPTTGPERYRQTQRLECRSQRIPGGIHGGGGVERTFQPGEDLLQKLRLVSQKFFDRAVPLSLVAESARQREIAYPIGAAFRARHHMLDFQQDVFGSAVGAPPLPLFEQVFPQFVPGERSLLIFNTGNLRVLELLHIEPDCLDGNRRDGTQTAEPLRPSQAVVHPRLDGWRQPAGGPGPVIEPGRTIAGLAIAPIPTKHPPIKKGFLDRRAPMVQLGGEDGNLAALDFRDQGDPGGLAPRIELEFDRLDFPAGSVLEDDREREPAIDRRLAFTQ